MNQPFSSEHLDYLERNSLDQLSTPLDGAQAAISAAQGWEMCRITEVTEFWGDSPQSGRMLQSLTEDFLSGLSAKGVGLLHGIVGRNDRVEVLMGTWQAGGGGQARPLQTVRTSLSSCFPGAAYEDKPPEWLAHQVPNWSRCNLLVGTPTPKALPAGRGIGPVDRLIRGMYGKDWAYLLMAQPAGNREINALYTAALNEVRAVMNAESSLHAQNPIAEQYRKLLESLLAKLQSGKAQGMWHNVAFLLSNQPDTATQLGALARSAFGGPASRPDRVRTLPLTAPLRALGLPLKPSETSPGGFAYPYAFMSTLPSSDLAALVQLPGHEMPGFRIKPYARFGVTRTEAPGTSLDLGELLDQGAALGVPYSIPLRTLTKHGLIVGTTGSGKTTTVCRLLRGLWEKGVPFLVIEPVKTEYRDLLRGGRLGEALRIFTLGNEQVAPFRLNPLSILPGVSVQAHIDLLKSVFNSSFFMWGPLPQVLELCLHEIYRDRGWDLTTGHNPRGLSQANPTLTDLWRKVDPVVNGLGYSHESTLEIRAALKTRLESLRIGGKGMMLDTRASPCLEALLQKPTVIELQAVADNEEKAFLMGIILALLYEYYGSRGLEGGGELKHVTVIEEAHRLLSRDTSENPYTGNVKGQAVETFTNILAEIRAYGEGFLIAEQIPTKLAPEIIKNTNLKVMHRLVAEDDRRVMAAAMNIPEADARRVVSLAVGQAAVFSEGWDTAALVRVPYVPPQGPPLSKAAREAEIKAAHAPAAESARSPLAACAAHCRAICQHRAAGEMVARDGRFDSLWPCVVGAMLEPKPPERTLQDLAERGLELAAQTADPAAVRQCALVQGASEYFDWLGSQYGWPYAGVERATDLFLTFFDSWSSSPPAAPAGSHRSPAIAAGATPFREHYRSLCQGAQPSRYCPDICSDRTCLYRHLLQGVLEERYYHDQFVDIINRSEPDMWKKLALLCREAAEELLLPSASPETLRRLALCFALQKSERIRTFSRRHIDGIMACLVALPEA